LDSHTLLILCTPFLAQLYSSPYLLLRTLSLHTCIPLIALFTRASYEFVFNF
jgi:hypothetical protein